MKIERIWAMPHKYTFSIPGVKDLLSRWMLQGNVWIGPFSGEFSPAHIKNDADATRPSDRHEDGLEFLKSFDLGEVCGVLFDPPYSTEQALRKYKPIQGGTAGRAEYWAKCKDEIARILCPDGVVISFGWDSTGMGKKRGFEIEEILLMCHGACHNDTIITVEKKLPEAR